MNELEFANPNSKRRRLKDEFSLQDLIPSVQIFSTSSRIRITSFIFTRSTPLWSFGERRRDLSTVEQKPRFTGRHQRGNLRRLSKTPQREFENESSESPLVRLRRRRWLLKSSLRNQSQLGLWSFGSDNSWANEPNRLANVGEILTGRVVRSMKKQNEQNDRFSFESSSLISEEVRMRCWIDWIWYRESVDHHVIEESVFWSKFFSLVNDINERRVRVHRQWVSHLEGGEAVDMKPTWILKGSQRFPRALFCLEIRPDLIILMINRLHLLGTTFLRH